MSPRVYVHLHATGCLFFIQARLLAGQTVDKAAATASATASAAAASGILTPGCLYFSGYRSEINPSDIFTPGITAEHTSGRIYRDSGTGWSKVNPSYVLPPGIAGKVACAVVNNSTEICRTQIYPADIFSPCIAFNSRIRYGYACAKGWFKVDPPDVLPISIFGIVIIRVDVPGISGTGSTSK